MGLRNASFAVVLSLWAFPASSKPKQAAMEDPPAASEAQPAVPSAEEIQQWIRSLGNEKFDERDAAAKALRKVGAAAKEALAKSAESDDIETRARAKEILEQIAEDERGTGRKYRLGVSMEPTVEGEGEAAVSRVKVSDVFPDSPAQAAGIRIGDVVVRFNGAEILQVEDLAAAVKEAKAGPVEVEILRDGKKETLKVKLGKEKTVPAELQPPKEVIRERIQIIEQPETE